MTNVEINNIIADMKLLNNKIIEGVEKNLAGIYYSSMSEHRQVLKEQKAIKMILEIWEF